MSERQPLLRPWRRIGLEGTRSEGREDGGGLSQNATSRVKGKELEIATLCDVGVECGVLAEWLDLEKH